MAEFTEEFLAYQATLNKPTELKSKRSIIENHLLPVFGKVRLNKIDARSIDRYKITKLAPPKPGHEVRSTRRKPNEGLSPKTVNNHLGVLGRMLKIAAKWELIAKTPEIEKLSVRNQPFDFLTFEEAEHFIQTAQEKLPSRQRSASISPTRSPVRSATTMKGCHVGLAPPSPEGQARPEQAHQQHMV